MRAFSTGLALLASLLPHSTAFGQATPRESAANASAPSAAPLPADLAELQPGDIVLQHCPGRLSSFHADLAASPWSNAALVVSVVPQPQVIEAAATVRLLPLPDFLRQGARGDYLILRHRRITPHDAAQAIALARTFLDRPGDPFFEPSDQRLYSTELLDKAFLRGPRLQIAQKSRLGDRAWRPCEPLIRGLSHGDLPLERPLVLPGDLPASRQLTVVARRQTPPVSPATSTDNTQLLSGTWQGDFAFETNPGSFITATATFRFGPKGEYQSGELLFADGKVTPVPGLGLIPYEATNSFEAELWDARGFQTLISGHIRDAGHRLVGHWKNSRSQRGLMSLARTADNSPHRHP